MKSIIRTWFVCLTGVALAAGCLWFLNTAQAASLDSLSLAPSLENIESKYILVDDFKDGDWQNELGGLNACYDENGGSISCAMHATVPNSYVEMNYNVTSASAYAWLEMDLGTVGNYADLSGLDAVWVVVRGQNGGERIYAEFKDCGPPETAHYPKVEIGPYIPGGIMTSWRAFAIPLTAFSSISDWSCIDRFSLVAHNSISSGIGRIYVDDIRLLPSRVLIDDFHDLLFENELGRPSGPWFTPPVEITTTFPGGVLKLSYDVPEGDYGGGYWTKLGPTNLLSQKDYLFLNVRGEQGGEEIGVEFNDCGVSGYAHYPEVKVSDYLAEGRIKDTWQTVAIPLDAFVEVQDDGDDGVVWNCIDQVSFNVSGNSQYTSGQGTVYIDDVRLVPASNVACRLPLLVDRFFDCNDRNALNWGWYTQTIGAAQFTAVPDPVNRRGNYGCGYRFTYDVKVEQSGWAWSELKGLDATDYTHLQFYIKGQNGGEATRVFLRDRDGAERYQMVEATNYWRQAMIPLNYFTPIVSLTDLSEVKFTFEEGYWEGEVYIDDISFMRPCTSLPIVLKNYREYCQDSMPSCSSPYNNYEPNNFRCSTNFALSSGEAIQSYICASNDVDDYYYIDVTTLNPITVRLTNVPNGVDYDLYLYYGDSLVAQSNQYGNADEEISYVPSVTGIYYIRVYPYSGYSLSSYTLQATFQ